MLACSRCLPTVLEGIQVHVFGRELVQLWLVVTRPQSVQLKTADVQLVAAPVRLFQPTKNPPTHQKLTSPMSINNSVGQLVTHCRTAAQCSCLRYLGAAKNETRANHPSLAHLRTTHHDTHTTHVRVRAHAHTAWVPSILASSPWSVLAATSASEHLTSSSSSASVVACPSWSALLLLLLLVRRPLVQGTSTPNCSSLLVCRT